MTLTPDTRCAEGHLWVCTLVDNRCMFCGKLQSVEDAVTGQDFIDLFRKGQITLQEALGDICPKCGSILPHLDTPIDH